MIRSVKFEEMCGKPVALSEAGEPLAPQKIKDESIVFCSCLSGLEIKISLKEIPEEYSDMIDKEELKRKNNGLIE